MSEWTILPKKFMLDANNMFKLIGKYVTKIVYVNDQAFQVGVVGNLVSALDVGFWTNMALPMQNRLSVFKKVYLANHLRDILDYSFKLLVFNTLIGAKVPKMPLIEHLL